MVYNDWLYYQYMASDGYVNLSKLCAISMRKLNETKPPEWYKIPPNFDDLYVIKAIQDGSSVCIFQGEEKESLDYLQKVISRMSNRDDWVNSTYKGCPIYINIVNATELKVEYGIEIHAFYHKIGIPFKHVKSTEEGKQYINNLIMRTGYLG